MIKSLQRLLAHILTPSIPPEVSRVITNEIELKEIVFFQEINPLAGTNRSFFWKRFNGHIEILIFEKNTKQKIEHCVKKHKLDETESRNLLNTIEEAGGMSLGNFSGKVKDGIYFVVVWGRRNNLNILDIKNPQFGSPSHQQFIDRIKDHLSGLTQL